MSLDNTGSGTPGAAAPSAPPELRKITDARTLRALAHPVRIAILEALSFGGAMTATEVGEQIGESSTTCSFHLRQLAKYGFVEEAGGGKGRARPWRMTTHGMEITNTHDDPDTEIAIDALVSLIRERQLDRYRTWRETRATYPRRWRDAAEDADLVFHLTAEELKQLSEDLLALLRSRFPERNTDPSLRPPGSVPVEMLVLAYPLTLPPADGDDREVTS
jgi:DNA-binding transcriptional ArsR family regulator